MLRIPSLQSCVTFAAVVMLLAGTAQATPTAMNFSGHLSDGAGGVSGPVEVTFTLYDNADTADGVQWSETLEIIVDGGSFNVFLGGDPGNLIPASAYGLAELFVAIQVENEAEMSPRIRMASVPYAIRAAEAETLSGTAAAGFAKSDQSCSPGDKVTGIGSNGEILHAPDVDINTDTIKVNSGHAELFIRAKYSFIDSWNNELAYLKVDDNIVWSKTCIYQTDGMTAASRTYAILLATPTTGCTSRQWFHTRVTPRTSPSGRIWPAVIPSPSEFQTSKSGNRTS